MLIKKKENTNFRGLMKDLKLIDLSITGENWDYREPFSNENANLNINRSFKKEHFCVSKCWE